MVQLLSPGMEVRSKTGDAVGTVRGLTNCCIEVVTASGPCFVPRREIFTVEHDGLTLASSADLSYCRCLNH